MIIVHCYIEYCMNSFTHLCHSSVVSDRRSLFVAIAVGNSDTVNEPNTVLLLRYSSHYILSWSSMSGTTVSRLLSSSLLSVQRQT